MKREENPLRQALNNRHINYFRFLVWGDADLAANWWQKLSNGWQIVIVVASVRIRWEGRKKKSELSSAEGKDNMTAVLSLPLSDIYPKHIKQIKKRKETISLGLWTLSLAFVSCSHVFSLFSPLSCLCDWLTCLFEEIPNVCLHNKTHRRTNTCRMYTDTSACMHKDNELAVSRETVKETDKDWLTDLSRASSSNPALTLLPFLWSIKMNSN